MTDETLGHLKEKILSNCGNDVVELVADYLAHDEGQRLIALSPQRALVTASLDAVLNLVADGKLMLVERN